MTWRNSRVVSRKLGLGVALGVVVAAFLSVYFDLNHESPLSRLSSAAGFLLFFGFGVLVVAGIAGVASMVAGRFVGTTIAGVVAAGLIGTMIVTSWLDARPVARLRRLVWRDAPASLQIEECRWMPSFSDGPTYTFMIKADAETIRQLCAAGGLKRFINEFGNDSLVLTHFPDARIPQSAEQYRGELTRMIYAAQQEKAYLVWDASLAR